jgi:transposase
VDLLQGLGSGTMMTVAPTRYRSLGYRPGLCTVSSGLAGQCCPARRDETAGETNMGTSQEGSGFSQLPRRWTVERDFAWSARCRRLARDHERPPETLAGHSFVTFAILILQRLLLAVARLRVHDNL